MEMVEKLSFNIERFVSREGTKTEVVQRTASALDQIVEKIQSMSADEIRDAIRQQSIPVYEAQERRIWFEMARRLVQFHLREDWHRINCWGLFYKSTIRKQLDSNELKPYGGYANRCLGWYVPTEESYAEYIEPILNTYTIKEIMVEADITPELVLPKEMLEDTRTAKEVMTSEDLSDIQY